VPYYNAFCSFFLNERRRHNWGINLLLPLPQIETEGKEFGQEGY
jgi:hypothetical protein